jgi:uncharacterized tellurite resistance protein B-like protein
VTASSAEGTKNAALRRREQQDALHGHFFEPEAVANGGARRNTASASSRQVTARHLVLPHVAEADTVLSNYMFIFEVRPQLRTALLRAMRTVALADGIETEKETALLVAVGAAVGLGAAELDPSACPGFSSAAALAEFTKELAATPAECEHIIQAMLLMALMDGTGSLQEAALIEQCAKLLNVTEPRVHNLRQLAEGRLTFMRLDLSRKGYAKDSFLTIARESGLRGLYQTFGPLVGLAEDHELARRYNDLGKLPEGTLGRAYWQFIVDNQLGFPGEPRAVAERGLWHDMSHVLGGYPTTPEGEAAIVAFIAGFRREDPFFWFFTIALQFQVGLKISPFAPGVPNCIDPVQLMKHHLRGVKVNRDLSEPWDVWADIPRPIDDVRREFNIVPLA